MCGQVGYSGKDNFDVDKIKLLILWNSFERGEDATGIYSPKNGLKKSTLKGSEFIINAKFDIIPDTLLMAHVRAKTVGQNTIENAHPFNRGNYILQHNGTLRNHWDLLSKHSLEFKDYHVDSDILTGCIAKVGDFTPLKEIDGPAACIIHDRTKPTKLYIFKNAERPLFKGYIGANMYISSLREPLVLIGCLNIKEFKDDRLYIIEDGSIVDHKPVKNTPYKRPSVNTTFNYNNYNHTGGYKTDPIYKAKGAWMRANCTLKSKRSGEPYFKLNKGTYYYIDDVKNLETLLVYDRESQKTEEVPVSCMNMYDLPKVGDYFIAIRDVYGKTNKDVKLYDRGHVFVSTHVYGDCDINMTDAIENKYYGLLDKSYFRKMFVDEIDEFKATFCKNISLSTVEVNNEDKMEEGKPIIDAESSPFDSENQDDQQDDYFQRLDDFFDVAEDKIESLNETINHLIIDVEVRNMVIDLMDFVTRARTEFLETLDNQEEEEEVNANN